MRIGAGRTNISESARGDIPDSGAYPQAGWRIALIGPGLRPADAVFLMTLLAFSILTAAVLPSSGAAWIQILKNLAAGLVLLGAIRLETATSSRAAKFWIRLVTAQLMFAYVFPLVTPLQLIVDKTWNDAAVLRLEQALFGVQPTIWIQKFISPPLTEWLMFSYVAYLPLYPILCGLLYFKRGEAAMENFIFALAAANLACCVGFILFPVAGPLYWMADRYTVPLKGSFFTAAGEIIRTHFQGIGCSIPSPHCANATIMGLAAFRHDRPAFYALAPIIVSIYVSAFYARYHYLSDVILGIVTGAAAFAVVPALIRAWNRRAGESSPPPGGRRSGR